MRYKIPNQNGLNFLTVVDWLDVFTRKAYNDIIIDSLKYCQKEKGLLIYAYVLMTNHIHLVAHTKEGFKLSDTIGDFKSCTGNKMIKTIQTNTKESRREWMLHRFRWNAKQKKSANRKYQFWQKINYVHLNSVKEGIVLKMVEYVYSSAKNYAEEEGLLEVELMDFCDEVGCLGV